MQKIQVKFSEWIEEAFNLYRENFKTLVLAAILVLVISAVTAGILAGPMLAGLASMILDLRDKKEPKPEVGRLFKGFDYFVPSFLYVVVWGIAIFIVSAIVGIIPIIGQLGALFVVYAAQAFLMFGLFLIVDRRMEFWPASQDSIDVVKSNFWPFFGLSVIAGFIGSVGAIAFGIGVVFTFPIQGCILTVAYRKVYG